MSIANIFGFAEEPQGMESQDVIKTEGVMDENQMMQEAALQQENQQTTQPPPVGYKGGTQNRPVGGTREAEDKEEDLYDININHLGTIKTNINTNNIEYAKKTFTALNRNIVLDGKTYTIDKLGELMKDQNKAARILKLADDLQENPELDEEVRWTNIENRVTNILLNGQLGYFNKRLSEEMYSAAKTLDAYHSPYTLQPKPKDKQKKEELGFFGTIGAIGSAFFSGLTSGGSGRRISFWDNQYTKFLFDEKGNLRTKKEFDKYIATERKKELQKIEQNPAYNVPSVEDLYGPNSNLSQFEKANWLRPGQRSDMYSWFRPTGSSLLRDEQGRKIDVITATGMNPLGLSMYELTIERKKGEINKINNSYNALSYDRMINDLVNTYNKSDSKSTNFRAIAEKKYTKDNKGGEIQTQTGNIPFDFNNAKYYDAVQKKNLTKTNIKEFNMLLSLVETDPGGQIIYNAGKVTEEPSQNEQQKADIIQLFKYMKEDRFNKKTSPKGSIEFQPNVKGADGQMYDAYTFTLDNNYIGQGKFKGEKKEKSDGTKEYTGLGWKNNRVYATKGFTIYVPSKVSKKNINTASTYQAASATSAIEGLLNTTGTTSMEIPGAGALTISKDDNAGTITFGGYSVDYNPSNGRYDTTRIEPNQIIVGSPDLNVDYIFINDYLRGLFKNKFSINNYLKRETLKQKGVKDPNQLTGQ